jgi:hypothetical protein
LRKRKQPQAVGGLADGEPSEKSATNVADEVVATESVLLRSCRFNEAAVSDWK